MPCVGCKQTMNDPKGLFKMRFICTPDGKLLKGAPGNYECGSIHSLPFRHSRFKFWELLEEAPVLHVPDITEQESVYEEYVFLPNEEDEQVAEITLSAPIPDEPELNLDPKTPATIEPYVKFNPGTGKISEIPDEVVEKELDRDALIEILTANGVEIKPRTRTTTLRKMVDELGV